MIDKITRLIHGGSKPPLTFAERALKMSQAHATFMEQAQKLEAEIAAKKADIEAAQARLAALNPAPKA